MKTGLKLAKNLNSLLAEKKISLSAICRATGINKSTMHNYCNGVTPSGLETIQKISDFFGVSIVELLYGEMLGEIKFSIEGQVNGEYRVKVEKIK